MINYSAGGPGVGTVEHALEVRRNAAERDMRSGRMTEAEFRSGMARFEARSGITAGSIIEDSGVDMRRYRFSFMKLKESFA